MIRLDIESLKKFRRRICYFAGNVLAYYTPLWLYKPYWRLRFALLSDKKKSQAIERVDYYVKLPEGAKLNQSEAVRIGDYKFPSKSKHKFTTYFYDLFPVVRMFAPNLKFEYLFGDIDYETKSPTLVKSRPIPPEGEPTLSALCRLDSIRHFMYVNDHTPWAQKKDMLISRNYVCRQPHRTRFLERTINSPMCDVGQINLDPQHPEFLKPFVTIPDHLKYKFIACIEGHDVASNLKWVMSSNSIAVMPRPKIESWFMEGTLIPNYHYIEIRDDYADIEERLQYYIDHPDEAQAIIDHAHEYVSRFRNRTLERWVMNQTVARYLQLTNGC